MLIFYAHEHTWCIVSHSVITTVLMAESIPEYKAAGGGGSEDVRTFAPDYIAKTLHRRGS